MDRSLNGSVADVPHVRVLRDTSHDHAHTSAQSADSGHAASSARRVAQPPQYTLRWVTPQLQPLNTPIGYRWRIVSAEHRRTKAKRCLAVLEREAPGGGPPHHPPSPPTLPAAASSAPRRTPLSDLETPYPPLFPPFRVA